MSQKTITLLLVLIVIGGLAWYVNKLFSGNYSDNFTENSKVLDEASKHAKPSLIFAKFDSSHDIFINTEDGYKKLFTDADEKEKVIKYSNVVDFKVLAIMAKSYNSKTGTLYEIDLKNAQKKLLQNNFPLPLNLSYNPSANKIAYTKFSNVEVNYGYTLYSEMKDGSLKKTIYNSAEEIKSPVWRSFSQLVFINIENTNHIIKEYRESENKTYDIVRSDNIIDTIFSEQDRVLYSIRQYGKSSGEIDIIKIGEKNPQKLIDFDGGIVNFISSDNKSQIAYVIGQYSNGQINEFTSGQSFIYNIDNLKRQSVSKCNQILGWQG